MAIGQGWAEGAWVDASWVVGAWEPVSAIKTIGGTSQLEAFSSTGGLDVQTNHTIGAVSQLEAFASSGFIQAGTAGLENFGSGSPARRPRDSEKKGFKLGLSQAEIKFVTVSQQFDVEVPTTGTQIEQTPSGIQGEIDRHTTALALLGAKIDLLQSSMIMKVEQVENDAMVAKQFLQELHQRVVGLRQIKKRRADEESIIVILMASE